MQKMPKSSMVVLNIHQVADIERKRLNSKDRQHSSSHTRTHTDCNNDKDGDVVSFVSLEQDEEERTSGETKASTSSTSLHDEDSYTASSYNNKKKDPTTYPPRPRRDSCTLSQCERGQDHDDDISLEGPASDSDHDSLFSESQNSSAVFSFVSDGELCQQGSVGGYDSNSCQSGMNATSIGEDAQDELLHVSTSHAKDEHGIRRKLILSFYGLVGALHRGACNVYSACWTFVKRKSWSIFAILYEG